MSATLIHYSQFTIHNMKKHFILFPVFLSSFFYLHAQDTTTAPAKHKIAIFAPLYLDSAFDYNDEYRYAKNVFPKFINPGLEFYEGVQLALDSLNKEKTPLEVFVYDTRSAATSLNQQLEQAAIDSVELIIAHL